MDTNRQSSLKSTVKINICKLTDIQFFNKFAMNKLYPVYFHLFAILNLSLTAIKAMVPYSISEQDVSAEAQQECRPQISIQFSPPEAFDFMMDPGCSLPHAKGENLTGRPVKGLFKEYRSKASIHITGKKQHIFCFTQTVLKPRGSIVAHAGRKGQHWNAALDSRQFGD